MANRKQAMEKSRKAGAASFHGGMGQITCNLVRTPSTRLTNPMYIATAIAVDHFTVLTSPQARVTVRLKKRGNPYLSVVSRFFANGCPSRRSYRIGGNGKNHAARRIRKWAPTL